MLLITVIPEFFEEKYPGPITLALEIILNCRGYRPRVFAPSEDNEGCRARDRNVCFWHCKNTTN